MEARYVVCFGLVSWCTYLIGHLCRSAQTAISNLLVYRGMCPIDTAIDLVDSMANLACFWYSVLIDTVGIFYYSRICMRSATAPSTTSDDCTDGDRLVLFDHARLI
jgi:hypothetical protein